MGNTKGSGVCPLMSSTQGSTVVCKGEKCHYWYGSQFGCVENWKAKYLSDIGGVLDDLLSWLKENVNQPDMKPGGDDDAS